MSGSVSIAMAKSTATKQPLHTPQKKPSSIARFSGVPLLQPMKR